MRDFHRRLAVVALRVLEPYGFVLAGGYAISAHGIGARPSMDVDLRAAGRWSEEFYARYDVDASTRARIVSRFTAWADQLEAPQGHPGSG